MQTEQSATAQADDSTTHKDPVCGMLVTRPDAPTVVHAGETYRFCCDGCATRFRTAPERYLNPTENPSEPEIVPGAVYICPMDPEVREDTPGSCPVCGMALEPETPLLPTSRTEYICPMHPEVVQDSPGSCPKCGMALEPRTITLEEEDNPELRDMSRRFWFAAVLALPLLVVAMGDMLPGAPISALLSPRIRVLLELALATPVCLWSAWPFYVRALQSVRTPPCTASATSSRL